MALSKPLTATEIWEQKICFVFNLLYLSGYHLYEMLTSYGGWGIDISIMLMINVAKFTSFAWCLKDGAEPKDKLSDDQFERRIVELPSLFNFFSYTFFYAAACSGPAFDYKEYSDFISLTNSYANIPNPFFHGIKTLFTALVCMSLLIKFAPQYNCKNFHNTDFFTLPFWKRIITVDITAALVRVRYYTAWLLATSNCIASGLSYNGKNKEGHHKWDRVVSVRPWEFEVGDNIKDKLEAWNSSIQMWFRRYVFFRVCPWDEIKSNPKQAAFASNMTFMVSAFWHGFYPMYYLVFFEFFLVQQVSKAVYNWRHVFRFIPPSIQYVLRWLSITWFFDGIGMGFVGLKLDIVLPIYASIYYIPVWLPLTCYVFSMLIGSPKKKEARDKVSSLKKVN